MTKLEGSQMAHIVSTVETYSACSCTRVRSADQPRTAPFVTKNMGTNSRGATNSWLKRVLARAERRPALAGNMAPSRAR